MLAKNYVKRKLYTDPPVALSLYGLVSKVPFGSIPDRRLSPSLLHRTCTRVLHELLGRRRMNP